MRAPRLGRQYGEDCGGRGRKVQKLMQLSSLTGYLGEKKMFSLLFSSDRLMCLYEEKH